MFSDSTCQILSQHSDGSHYITNKPQFLHRNLRQKPLYFCKYIWKNIFCTNYCIAHHDDKTCFLSAGKYHIILLGNVEKLLKKSDTICFTYQHVDCLYTLFKYRFSEKVFARSGQVFDNVQRAVDFSYRNKGVDRRPSMSKKRFLMKNIKKHLFSSFQKTKTTQISGSVFAEGTGKLRKTKFEVELIKIVDCFLDGHGNYDSNLVYLE